MLKNKKIIHRFFANKLVARNRSFSQFIISEVLALF